MYPDAPNYFEGDIILTDDQRYAIEMKTDDMVANSPQQKAITLSENRLWDGGRVPYFISSSLSESFNHNLLIIIID